MLPGKQLEVGIRVCRTNALPSGESAPQALAILGEVSGSRSNIYRRRLDTSVRQRWNNLVGNSRRVLQNEIAQLQKIRASLPNLDHIRSIRLAPPISVNTQALRTRLGTMRANTQERLSQIVHSQRSGPSVVVVVPEISTDAPKQQVPLAGQPVTHPNLPINPEIWLESDGSYQRNTQQLLTLAERWVRWRAGPQKKTEPNFASTQVLPPIAFAALQELRANDVHPQISQPSLRHTVQQAMNYRITPDLAFVSHGLPAYMEHHVPVWGSWRRPFRDSSNDQQTKVVVNSSPRVKALTEAHIRERGIITVLDELREHQLQLQDTVRASEKMADRSRMGPQAVQDPNHEIMLRGARAKSELLQTVQLPKSVLKHLRNYLRSELVISEYRSTLNSVLGKYSDLFQTSSEGKERKLAETDRFKELAADLGEVADPFFGGIDNIDVVQKRQQGSLGNLIAEAYRIALPGGIFPTTILQDQLTVLEEAQKGQKIEKFRPVVRIKDAMRLTDFLMQCSQYSSPERKLTQGMAFKILGIDATVDNSGGELISFRFRSGSLARKYLSSQMRAEWARKQLVELPLNVNTAEKARRLGEVFVSATRGAAEMQMRAHKEILAQFEALNQLNGANSTGDVAKARLKVVSGPILRRVQVALGATML